MCATASPARRQAARRAAVSGPQLPDAQRQQLDGGRAGEKRVGRDAAVVEPDRRPDPALDDGDEHLAARCLQGDRHEQLPARALREVRRRGRAGSTGALS